MPTDFAWTGTKTCGCTVFARLTSVRRGLPLAKACKGLTVDRVPVSRAAVVICDHA